ncbi:hypothetical protein CU097_008737 [Rhizopus azygosporus]|uniref:Uncharacterized protein n=1 Tax=Rhizopus azygosporus TaxID=86630 RepID=A0A367JDU0_RHIAZ|nr:hypothetical protein CU097_008737 [Rhizopus azygosporus]
MTQTAIAYKDIKDPLKTLVDPSSKKNTADILCPKESCKCVILKRNTATLVERDASKLQLPASALPDNNIDQIEENAQFWLVGNMMDFENTATWDPLDTMTRQRNPKNM